MAGPILKDAQSTDPPLLRDNSTVRSYTAARSGITYPGVRVYHRRHPKVAELPVDPAPLPMIVFIHGLGGSVAQFHPLLTSLVNSASTLAIDLPGCGRSDFAPTTWDAYTTEALADLLETVIDNHRAEDQGVVFIAHSMGTVFAARLANKMATHHTALASHVMGIVAICPVSSPLPESTVNAVRKLLWIPETIFDLWRSWDRWGGPNSASVKRFVGQDADFETRVLQDRFNTQSRSGVFRRMAWGSLPTYVNGEPIGGLFGEPVWTGLDLPVYLIGGEHDTVTPPSEVDKIAAMLTSTHTNGASKAASVATDSNQTSPEVLVQEPKAVSDISLGESAAPINTASDPKDHLPITIEAISDEDFERKQRCLNAEETYEDPTTPQDQGTTSQIPHQPRHPRKVVKTIKLPSGHALLYTPSVVRILAGLVGDFLNDHITGRFSLGWQLQYLSREGKWDVKNLAKWKSVRPVSEPIAGIFRAMKTLREVDNEHCPKVFAAKWGNIIKDVIDISHDNPVYDPRSFGDGIKYHKFPTVSKIPPTDEEVESFIKIVDQVREDQKLRSQTESGWPDEYFVGVHCHYGFNRTGYFIVCYLVEKCNFGVQEAIDTFATCRPNGIRHVHFLDRLFVRYSGLSE